MKFLLALLLVATPSFADTPPPGTVKAKTYTGDGLTAITSTGASGALDVNVTNSGGLSTVNQGNAGLASWLVDITNTSLPVTGTFWQATQPVSGTLTCNAGTGTLNVDASGHTVPVSGTFWQATQPVSGTLTCNAGSGTQAVSLASLPALAAGANTIGNVNINGTVPISGSITATNTANANTGGAVPAQATQVGGVDGSGNLEALKVSALGVLSVDGSAVTQPVSAASLPLPTGAATSALQTTGNTSLASIDTKTPALVTGRVPVDGSGVTQPVSAAALPLPSGASTSAKQPALGTAGSASSDVLTVQGITSMTALKVDGSAVTQPVSAASMPLPTGASTAANQSTIITNLGSPFQAGGSIGNTSFAATQATAASLNATVVTTGGTTIAKDSSLSTINTTLGSPMQNSGGSVTANAGTGTFTVDASGHTVPISAAALPLPTGAATDASVTGLQVSQGSTTSGQKGGLGLGAVTTSAPSYTTAQSSPLSLTTAGALRTDASATTQPVSISTLPAGSNTIGNVNINGTVPVSGSFTATSPADGNTGSAVPAQATQVGGVDGSGNLRALKVSTAGVLSIDGSAVTQPVSAASLPLPSGAATSALQTTGNTSLASIDTKTPALGQTTMSASQPVTIASDQSAIPTMTGTLFVTGSAAANNTDIFPSTDISGYSSVYMQMSGTFSATVTAQFSNDNSTFVNGLMVAQNSSSATPVSGTLSTGIYKVFIQGRYMRIRTTSYSSGTVNGSTMLKSADIQSPSSQIVTPSTTIATTSVGTVASGSSDSGAPVKIGSIFNTSLPTVTTGQRVDSQADANGRLIVTPQQLNGNSPGSSTVSTVATLTAPANTVGFVLMNLDTSTANIRWRIGATATTSSGQQLQPGRDTGYIPCGANISIVAESGTQNYDVQWILK